MVARTTLICCLLVLGLGGVSGLAQLPPAPTPALVAGFEVASEDARNPLQITLKDASAGQPISWRWDLGDKGTSTERNPMHTYKRGTYTVKLTVADRLGSTATKTESVTVPLPVQFVARPGAGPLSIRFTDTSPGEPVRQSWDFGEKGGKPSFGKDAEYTYQRAGTYTVRLTITNRAGLTMTAAKRVPVPLAKETRF